MTTKNASGVVVSFSCVYRCCFVQRKYATSLPITTGDIIGILTLEKFRRASIGTRSFAAKSECAISSRHYPITSCRGYQFWSTASIVTSNATTLSTSQLQDKLYRWNPSLAGLSRLQLADHDNNFDAPSTPPALVILNVRKTTPHPNHYRYQVPMQIIQCKNGVVILVWSTQMVG